MSAVKIEIFHSCILLIYMNGIIGLSMNILITHFGVISVFQNVAQFLSKYIQN